MGPVRARTPFPVKPIRHHRFKKAKLIFNPHSGQGLALPFLSDKSLGVRRGLPHPYQAPNLLLKVITHHLRAFGISVEPAITDSPIQATAIARRCAQANYDLVIAVGGDGTVNAVVNGLAGSTTALAIIPSGTINVLGLQLDLPTDLQEACRRIHRGETARIDLGRLDTHYFTCMAGVGFDAHVIKSTHSGWKRLIGAVAYGLVALDSLFTFPFRSIHFQIDDRPEVFSGYFVVVGNVKYYASNLVLLPRADPADGFLDVAVFKKKTFWRYAFRLASGKSPGQPLSDVDYYRCKTIAFAEGRHPVQLDGDYYGRTPVSIRVVPEALRVVI